MNRDADNLILLADLGYAGNAFNFKFFGWRNTIDAVSTLTSGTWNPLSSDYVGIPAPATALEVVSTSAQDAAAGAGAQRLRIFGLDAADEWQNVSVVPLGVGAAAVPGTWNEYSKMQVDKGAPNVGAITLRVAGGGAVVDIMRVFHTVSRGARFYVPDDYDCVLTGLIVTPMAQVAPPSQPPIIHLLEDGMRLVASWSVPLGSPGTHTYATLHKLSPSATEYRLVATNENGENVPGLWVEGKVLMVPN